MAENNAVQKTVWKIIAVSLVPVVTVLIIMWADVREVKLKYVSTSAYIADQGAIKERIAFLEGGIKTTSARLDGIDANIQRILYKLDSLETRISRGSEDKNK